MDDKEVYLEETKSTYPNSDCFFSPSIKYPEYPFNEISPLPNLIYDAIRNILYRMGLDHMNYGTPKWNPLREFVEPGQKVLIKPNLVMNYEKSSIDCLVTHGSIIRAILDYVFLATNGISEIIIGDAPLQSANFNAAKQEAGWDTIKNFYDSKGIPIKLLDFRSEVTTYSGVSIMKVLKKGRANQNCEHVLISIDKDSLLYRVEDRSPRFRVTCYNPIVMSKHHGKGKHEYCIAKPALEADLFINLPKLKTHRKAGITCSLKNLIGINSNKDYLPHHTEGSIIDGGDEYLSPSFLKRVIVWTSNKSNMTYSINKKRIMNIISAVCGKMSKVFSKDKYFEGSWFGNDTIWRTILDINRILFYSDKKGKLSDYKNTKKYLTIVDAVVIGEGEGPLEPSRKFFGYLAAGTNPVAIDTVMSSMMGFDYLKIPTIKNAYLLSEKPLTNFVPRDIKIFINNNKNLQLNALPMIKTKPSNGWKEHIELYNNCNKPL